MMENKFYFMLNVVLVFKEVKLVKLSARCSLTYARCLFLFARCSLLFARCSLLVTSTLIKTFSMVLFLNLKYTFRTYDGQKSNEQRAKYNKQRETSNKFSLVFKLFTFLSRIF